MFNIAPFDLLARKYVHTSDECRNKMIHVLSSRVWERRKFSVEGEGDDDILSCYNKIFIVLHKF